MNILLCGNSNGYMGMETVVYSLLNHNKGANIYIFTMNTEVTYPNGEVCCWQGLNDWQKNKLRHIVKYMDSTSNIKIIDVSKEYETYLADSVNRYSGFTPYASLRLLSDLILVNVDEVLYLDCDTAITGDISGVYNEYAIKDVHYSAYVAQDACGGEGEMISGVMLMNLKKMRESGFMKTARRYYNTNLYNYPDQCALRDTDKPAEFPPSFGYCEDLYVCTTLPLIIHFTNAIEPKIYDQKYNRAYFFRKFPFLKYIKDGAELIDQITFRD